MPNGCEIHKSRFFSHFRQVGGRLRDGGPASGEDGAGPREDGRYGENASVSAWPQRLPAGFWYVRVAPDRVSSTSIRYSRSDRAP